MAGKAKKRKHQMPPLSFLDKLIYWTIMLVLCVVYFGLIFLTYRIRDNIAFADEMVLAKEDNISTLWAFIPWLTFFLMTFIPWSIAYSQDRRPIFGLRNFKYGPPAWPKVYPLFMKNKPYVWVSERAKRDRRSYALLLAAVLLISFIPFPWSLYGRDCLRYDGGIEQYNMFNAQVQEFSSGQIAAVEFEAYRHHQHRSIRVYWDVRVTLTTDSGKEYTFAYDEFRSGEAEDAPYWLTAMLQLKRRYAPEIITYSGIDDLEKVIADNHLNDPETEMLHQLFGLK